MEYEDSVVYGRNVHVEPALSQTNIAKDEIL
jgi:hypothetical protein